MTAVFAQLNQGEGITKGLKKVDKSEMTHKNPELRGSGAVPSTLGALASALLPEQIVLTSVLRRRQGSAEGAQARLDAEEAAQEGARRQQVEHRASLRESLELNGADGSSAGKLRGRQGHRDRPDRDQPDCQRLQRQVVHHPGQGQGQRHLARCAEPRPPHRPVADPPSVAVNCPKTSILLESTVSSLSVSNSPSFTVQILGKVPTVLLDGNDGGQVYLSKDSLDCEIVTAKCSALNISIPVEGEEDGVFVEKPVPEQFKTVVQDGKLHTIVVEHSA